MWPIQFLLKEFQRFYRRWVCRAFCYYCCCSVVLVAQICFGHTMQTRYGMKKKVPQRKISLLILCIYMFHLYLEPLLGFCCYFPYIHTYMYSFFSIQKVWFSSLESVFLSYISEEQMLAFRYIHTPRQLPMYIYLKNCLGTGGHPRNESMDSHSFLVYIFRKNDIYPLQKACSKGSQ